MKLNLILLLALAQAPSVPSSSGQGFIRGLVLSDRGQPVVGATVNASWYPLPTMYVPGTMPQAVTDAGGRFVISNLAAGSYRVSASMPGYVTQQYVAPGDATTAGTVLVVRPDQTLQDVTIRLVPDSIISGRITSTDGQPLLRMSVTALKRRFDANGWPTWGPARVTETNDRGEYRISGLSPGDYYLHVMPVSSALIFSEVRRAQSEGRTPPVLPTPGLFAAAYYPGVERTSEASTVRVQEGVESSNNNLTLSKQKSLSVRGRVTDNGGVPSQKPTIGAMPAYAEYVIGTGSSVEPYQADGTFALTGLAPGRYWITAQLTQPLTPAMRELLMTPGADLSQLPRPARGVALVSLVDADVDNVVLSIARDLEVLGHVTFEGGALDPANPLKDIKLELRPVDMLSNGGPMSFKPTDSAGGIQFKRLLPTAYRLTVSALPPPLYVKQARLGRIDPLTESILLTTPTSDRLEIVLARGSEVPGTLTNDQGGPVASQTVVLIPDQQPARPDLFRTATTGANGRFIFTGVAPGNYHAFSWQTMEPFQYFDEAFVKRFDERGSPVVVTGTSPAAINVKSIPTAP